MQKILGKRVFRDLKQNIWRYLALAFLIILGMYLVISITAAAETVMTGVDDAAEKNQLEDGQFSVFVPLTKAQKDDICNEGAVLEEMFNLDYDMTDGSTLRVFQTRKTIDLIDVDEGRLPEKIGECLIEKRYAQERKLAIGDSITIGSVKLTITALGSTPDYDAPLNALSDSNVDSTLFGTIFVTKQQYQNLKKQEKSAKTEEYLYAYRLSGTTDEKLKSQLEEFEFQADEITDRDFQDYWEETGGQKDDVTDGVKKLSKGAEQVNNALQTLKNRGSDLKKGAAQIFDAFLSQAQDALKKSGFSVMLTEDNFEEKIEECRSKTESALVRLSLGSAKDQLCALKQYKDGVTAYTKGVAKSAKGSDKVADGTSELKDKTDELLEQYFDMDAANLTQFIKAEDNPRIKASSADQVINRMGGLVAGVIVMILFTYVISVFVIHGIETESSVIGAIYALGVKKRELMIHYIMLPVVVTFLASVVGTAIGFSQWGISTQMQDCYTYFSIPELAVRYPLYLLLYGVVMPPVIAVIVNCIVINKRLSKPVLSLLKKDQKGGRMSNIKLGSMGFVARFRIRQMLREARTGLTVVFGMFISMIILMMALDCYAMCNHIKEQNVQDTKYNYMYTYKYPEKTVPEGGTACYAETLSKESFGQKMDVTLLGIGNDNPYFDVDVKKGKEKVAVSSAAAERFHLSVGDKLVLKDEENEQNYAFTVSDITQYSVGFYVFMDIDSMRDLMNASDGYFNMVLSDKTLDIDAGRLYAVTSKEKIEKSSSVFVDMMAPMVIMLTVVSILIFFVVLYLMLKVMIDRSAFSISLIKVFGYRESEVRKLYLNGNFYIVAVGAFICIPLSKWVMDSLYPLLISNISCGMNLTFSWQMYIGIFVSVIILYFIINQLLVHRLKKMMPAEVLKERE